MKTYALLTILLTAVLIGPPLAQGTTSALSYRKTTSVFEGKATCAYRVRVQDAGGQTMTFTLLPAAESATTGENGGEIRMLEPTAASTGIEEACEAYPDTSPTGTVTVPDDDHTFNVILQLHSHPDNNCSASGLARGRVRMHVPNPGALAPEAVTCDTNEGRGNVRSKRKRRARGATTGAVSEFVFEVINDGPGPTNDTTVTTTIPYNAVFVESATAGGQPCTIGTQAGPPAVHVINCDLGMLQPDDPVLFNLDVIPRQTGTFTTTVRVDAANNGPLHAGTDRVSTNVAQGVQRTLAVTAKARNGGDGSVNISPDGGAPTCTTPSGGNNTVQCFNFYDNNTTVTLTAKPGTGSSVVWEGACAGTVGNTCTLTMSSDRSTTVKFVK
ncbi:MAG: hypothetical protein HYR51_10275 [Candidatus Rokubacteria bacterium]|nr:hypothetical protein [Candidatus Rokubacteria bacterium]